MVENYLCTTCGILEGYLGSIWRQLAPGWGLIGYYKVTTWRLLDKCAVAILVVFFYNICRNIATLSIWITWGLLRDYLWTAFRTSQVLPGDYLGRLA